MAVKINGEITAVNVKKKTTKERAEDGSSYEETSTVAKVTIEFDADTVDVGELVKMINGRYSVIEVQDPKF